MAVGPPRGSVDYKETVTAQSGDVNKHEITHARRIINVQVATGEVEVDFEMDDASETVEGDPFTLTANESHVHDFGQRFRMSPEVPDKVVITAQQDSTEYSFTLEYSEARTAARPRVQRNS